MHRSTINDQSATNLLHQRLLSTEIPERLADRKPSQAQNEASHPHFSVTHLKDVHSSCQWADCCDEE